MKRITALLCTALIMFAFSLSYADDYSLDDINLYDLKRCFSENDARPSIDMGWLIERYELSHIEEYIEYQYGTYYKYYEQYFVNKQREIAGKFGLSSIYVRPSFKKYDHSKLILTRNVWENKLTLRYLAPFRDMTDFEVMMTFRPMKSVSFVVKSEINGESSIAAAITHPLGKRADDGDPLRFTKRLLKKVTGIQI